ncbi:uncharacterized protein N7511_007058 [Penicillium nucicola]|uniref:uncharacterized protein n=1 Tax=Penicillium nucicola TaxID=1850975 RepID=UPI0025450E43|nr:uncharacterized protein N7511_007058 [Penicillium nucicola]KAJ5756876.1 hypothetical protein N7511_007058 [Penicillium nucicola]
MDRYAKILGISALLMQALPTAARPGVPGWDVGSNVGMGAAGNVMLGDDHDDGGSPYQCGNGGFGDHGDYDHHAVHTTVTERHCHNTHPTITVTDTLIESTTQCTATYTDVMTLTVDGPTSTVTRTTAGPIVTSTVTTGAATVTLPESTETLTIYDTTTATDTSTITDYEVMTSTQTITQTDTLEITTTVTSETCTPTGGGGGNTIDYGTCSDPYILYEYGLDGRTDYSYTNRNQADFPFGSSPTIDSPEDLICNRLRSPCNAPQATIDLCYEAEDATRDLSGQEAADVWNSIMT